MYVGHKNAVSGKREFSSPTFNTAIVNKENKLNIMATGEIEKINYGR
jgi:hypothetical protein